ncbi:hypothetical protein Pmani_018578 [Petrolisthes manimaculis]|uniref:Integrase catalytic domain-containing protein n=1 Tax=Petrolisthes manimaculis TaxID=1843537 RepID=A0AAE1PMN5_9EUCA|nr:hypothetical protein Pmani_018578 [Petrolisthes manimaculis]
MTKDFDTLKSERTVARTKATKLVKDLNALWSQKEKADLDDLAYNLSLAENHFTILNSVKEQLHAHGIPDDTHHLSDLDEIIFKSKRLLARLEKAAETRLNAAPHSTCATAKPLLHSSLPTFKGDLLAWPEFRDLFSVAVHDNPLYSPVEKFVQLKGHLDGEAAKCLQGLATTNDNYDVALRILKQRFGNETRLKESLMASLLNTPRFTEGEDLRTMRGFIDELTAKVRALEVLEVSKDNYSPLLLPVLKSRIPESWRLQWARYKDLKDVSDSDLGAFLEFLEEEVTIRLESAQPPIGSSPRATSTVPSTPRKSVTSVLNLQRQLPTSGKKRDWICKACNHAQHGLFKCHQYRKMSVDNRWAIVKEAGLCFQCLGPHTYRSCTSNKCPLCDKPHHSSLHRQDSRMLSPFATSYQPSQSSSIQPGRKWTNRAEGNATVMDHHAIHQGVEVKSPEQRPHTTEQRYSVATKGCCYSCTALVVAVNGSQTRLVRLLLDGGSDSSYIRASVADDMGVPVTHSDAFACIGFQERAEKVQKYDQVRITLRGRNSGPSLEFDLWKTDHLCAPLPPRKPPSCTTLQGIQLADDFSAGPIDILIGTDQIYNVILWKQIPISKGLRAIETVFGYVVHGGSEAARVLPHRHSYYRNKVDSLWKLDCLGIADEELKDVKNYPEPRWNEKEKRYEMNLVWNSEDRPVTNIRSTKARTNKMTSPLDAKEFEEYEDHLASLYQSSTIEYSPNHHDHSAFFLPHRGIHRNGKLRVVFDGSAKDGLGKSLNSYLDPGSNLLSCLLSVILNFRAEIVGCQSDIKAAFHQILIQEEDRQYVQFLWDGEVLRFQRVPFGLSCSPFMLLHTISTHLHHHPGINQRLRHLIDRGIYMDDLCISFSSAEEAESGLEGIRNIFAAAGMELHKLRMTGLPSDNSSILGMGWNTSTDQLTIGIPRQDILPNTKSGLLSLLSKPFDPLGMLTPWLIGGKLIFQETWKHPVTPTWTAELPTSVQAEVEEWWKDALNIRDVALPRCAGALTAQSTIFCVFCDASQRPYCTAIYAVTSGESQLLVAKGRLSPLTPSLTIPRLELMAAYIGVKLMKTVCQALDLHQPNVLYWSDSMDVICWIKSNKQLKLFVKNRVSSIRQLSSPEQWHHVSGLANPADLGTRGISLSNLVSNQLWWKGPEFLRNLPTTQPSGWNTEDLQLSETAKLEVRGTNTTVSREVTTVTTQRAQDIPAGPFTLTNCSSLKKAVTCTAWIRRFCHNVRCRPGERKIGSLSPDEKRDALHFWIRLAQEKFYFAELDALRNGTTLPHHSSLSKVRPHLCKDGLLKATLRTNEPSVIILPDLGYITTLIVDEAHRQCFHQSTRTTLALVSAEYLVRRRTVLRIVSSCGRCRRYRGLPYNSAEGTLPEFRTTPARAFSKVGLDYFGPIYVDPGETKVWGLLITCATTRAVHLEVVRTQSTEDLQLALRRFFALRGTPSLIYSDNAKSFKKLSGVLPRSTCWRYIPEASPWWGGFWERLVACVKKSLKITLHQCRLSYDELATTFYELALHLNLRPLTRDNEDAALTPAHFLFGITSIRGVVSPAVDPAATLDRAWRNRRRISDHLTRRWTGEYLQTLRTWNTSPRGRPVRTPSVGEVVLVHGESTRAQWPMGRILSLIPGRDGHPRAATIRLKGRITRRPINKLYRLEAAQDVTNAQESDHPSDATTNPLDVIPAPPTVTTRSGRVICPPQRLVL